MDNPDPIPPYLILLKQAEVIDVGMSKEVYLIKINTARWLINSDSWEFCEFALRNLSIATIKNKYM